MGALDTLKTITELAQKGMTIELQEKIMELREELISLKEENIQLREANLVLKHDVERYSQTEQCPKCKKATWELVGSKPHPIMSNIGILEREYKCSECGFSEKYTYKPNSKGLK